MEVTGSSYEVKFTIDEFTDLISQEEWDRLYKKICEKARDKITENPKLEYMDCTEHDGHISFILST